MRISLIDHEIWRETFTTLAHNKTRTFLTAFGIFWGTAILALLWGGAQGFEGIMRREFAGLAANIGGVSSWRTTMAYRGFPKGMAWELTIADIDNIRRLAPDIESSSTINWASVDVSHADHSKRSQIIGVEEAYPRLNTVIINSGRFINASDIAATRKVAVIGRNLANELFGGEEAVGQQVQLAGISFMVVGVASQMGEASIGARVDESVIMPSSTMRQAFNQGNTVHFFIFAARPGTTPTDSRDAIMRAIRLNHPIHPLDDDAAFFQDFSEFFSIIDKVFLGISLLALFVGGCSLLAGVIGVGNIMWIVVRERTHEFGVRRAIGAKPWQITAQVLCESILLTTVAGAAGVCFAALILAVIDQATADPLQGLAGFELPFGVAVSIIGVFILLGSLAGTLPAVKALRIKPVEAMRAK